MNVFLFILISVPSIRDFILDIPKFEFETDCETEFDIDGHKHQKFGGKYLTQIIISFVYFSVP